MVKEIGAITNTPPRFPSSSALFNKEKILFGQYESDIPSLKYYLIISVAQPAVCR